MHANNDHLVSQAYATDNNSFRILVFSTQHVAAAPPEHQPSLDAVDLRELVQDKLSSFEKLAEIVISPSAHTKFLELSLCSMPPDESDRLLAQLPASIQALAYFSRASHWLAKFDCSSFPISEKQRNRTLYHAHELISKALFLLETVQSRSEKARIAGIKSHSQSDEIKAEALRLLEELCPRDGWRSMSQAAEALHERLYPLVKEQRGRLNPQCLKDRLLGWLCDTRDTLNPRYHEFKRKRKN